MILTAHQPVYHPWLGLFHKIHMADKFVFFDDVQYVPKDWQSRNYIKSQNGPVLLTVPVLKKGYLEKKISEIEINNDSAWQRKHWKSISQSYLKAPFFKQYSERIEALYSKEWTYLADLNFDMLLTFMSILGIETEVEKASDYQFEGAKSDLVLDMCLKLDASTYIFGEMGEDYADKEAFQSQNVDLVFQKYNHPKYNQLYGDFVPKMSVLDLIFNEGEKSLEILTRQ